MKNYICFTGQSGAGKGTHTTLLHGHLTSRGHHVVVIENGELVRHAERARTIFSESIRKMNHRGLRQPVVYMAHLWLQAMEQHVRDDTIVIHDGGPRSVAEVQAMQELLQAGFLPDPLVYILQASREVCEERLHQRTIRDKRASLSFPGQPGRPNPRVIRQKLDWWENEREDIINAIRLADMETWELDTTKVTERNVHEEIAYYLRAHMEAQQSRT